MSTVFGLRSLLGDKRHHVADFIMYLLDTRSPATASVRFRALQQLFGWLVDEEEIDVSPMAEMRKPVAP